MKIAISGLGSIGIRHLGNLNSLLEGACEFILSDPRLEFQKEKISLTGAKWIAAGDTSQVLQFKPDLILICTPSSLHFESTLPYIETGIPIFIEKPFVIEAEQARQLVSLSNGHVIIGANMRYSAPVSTLIKLLVEKKLGDVFGARAWFGENLAHWRPGTDYRQSYSAHSSMGGGILWDAIHELDYLYWLFGDYETIHVLEANRGLLGIQAEETADILIRHNSQVVSSIHLDYLQQVKVRGCEIYGTKATFVWRSTGKSPEERFIAVYGKSGTEVLFNGPFDQINQMYLDQSADLLALVNDTKTLSETSLLSAQDAMKEVEWVEAARRHHKNV